jgi:hypothetical protein
MPTMATQYSEIFYRQRWSANRGQPRLILGSGDLFQENTSGLKGLIELFIMFTFIF